MRMYLAALIFLLTTCHGREIIYSIDEEVPNGTYIGNVAMDSNLMSEMTPSDFRTLRYSLLSGDSYVSLFTINQTSGNLYTSQVVDREQVCRFSTVCKISFEAAAQSSIRSYFTKILLIIYIQDINDHSPVFPRSSMSLNIPESTLIGNSFTIDGAKDADTSPNYTLNTYTLEQTNSPFSVSFVKNLDGTSVVKLVVDRELDREVQDSYNLVVIASDGGNPPRSEKMLVNVRITDVNDNAPMLSSTIYNVSVREDVTVGTVILTLSATDLDTGKNAEIRYRLSSHQSENIKQLFAINESTGELSVAKTLPYNDGNPYRIIVEASDLGDQPLTTQTSVKVTVIDSGNNPPEIHVTLLPPSDVARISEDTSVGAVIAHVVVIDSDSGMNGYVTCTTDNSYFNIQRLEVNEYKVTVAQPLDRETSSSHTITIVCTDSGTPPLASTHTFKTIIQDSNDNAPIFTSNIYQGSIPENNRKGAQVIQVQATDADDGINAEVEYKLVLSNESQHLHLTIDTASGRVTTGISFDREKISSFIFKVIASDKGSEPKSSTATVMVKVNDENDVPPTFTENMFLFKVSERKPSGTAVGRLMATDFDEGVNGEFEFYSESGTQPFNVTKDGIVLTTRSIDRESQELYDFAVYVVDKGQPPKSSSARVKITIADENDNSPKFIFPTSTNNTVLVPRNTKPGTIIARIRASDPDKEQNGEITYGIEGTNSSEVFYANIHTGDIIAKKGLEEYSGQTFNLMAVARDRGLVFQTSRAEFFVKVAGSEYLDSNSQTNITIVIVLVTVTLALSGFIILAICIIRWLDNHRKNPKDVIKAEKPYSSPSVSRDDENKLSIINPYIDGAVDADKKVLNISRYTGPADIDRRQKNQVVTFAPDIKDEETSLSVPNSVYGESLPSFPRPQAEDNQSNCSMNSTNSDSGRGLSDDETRDGVGRGMLYHSRKGKFRSSIPSPINVLHQDRSTKFFPDRTSPLSPINHPVRSGSSYGNNSFKYQNRGNTNFDVHPTFSFNEKIPLQEQDSDGTSGIHTMEEIPSPHFSGNVV
ncbi:protocadherin beta-11-like [Saccostrea echinata]|uniref:protocadherin beta-11-like n=1 Tax=Saccostrea echinata TaxID=191078 RepID=UPI002A8311A9|nr:protocadherin beta-11-like [Saccostrea echinata]XP_061164100.1 protocadherin beta-11-like [Saccostrea echinata]